MQPEPAFELPEPLHAVQHAIEVVRPALRGISHLYAFPISLVAGGAIVYAADSPRSSLAALVYAVSISMILGVSALYHRVHWRGRAYRWMRRLDHSGIFLTMAGTYTAFWLSVLEGPLSDAILVVAWAGCTLGVTLKMVWIDAPKVLGAIAYTCFGLVGLLVVPQLFSTIGAWPTSLLLVSGLAFLAGGVVYTIGRPDPYPNFFGFHEVFHALVVFGLALQYAVMAVAVFPH